MEGSLLPIRVYALAKQLKLDSKVLVDICIKAGIMGKGSALASLTDEEYATLKEFMASGGRRSTPAAEAIGSASSAFAAPTAPQTGREAAAIRRADYLGPGDAPAGNVPMLLAPKQKPSGEAAAPKAMEKEKEKEKEKAAPKIKLAPMPAMHVPSTVFQSDEHFAGTGVVPGKMTVESGGANPSPLLKKTDVLVKAVLANPTGSLVKLCSLVPELPPSEVLPYIQCIRNAELARKVFEASRQQYEDGRTRKIAELEQQAKEVQRKLKERRDEDLAEVLEIILEPFVDSGEFPVTMWPDFEKILRGRRYGYKPLQLLERAEQCYETLAGPSGMFRLASSYLRGRRGPNASDKGLTWMRKAAERGHRTAQDNMGRICSSGKGVPQNFEEAAKWFQMAAAQGDPSAQYRLGICYAEGTGVTKDEAEAVKWFRKATEQGDSTAQFRLGLCYAEGKGVTKDEAEAVKWFREAAEQGNSDAATRLRTMAEQGNAVAQFALGECYHRYNSHVVVAKDDRDAVNWFHKAAEQGHAEAQNKLGLCYSLGEGVAQDITEGMKWFRKAAEQGNAEALKRLHALAEKGNAFAQFTLGECYYRGRGAAKDPAAAANWLRKAAEQGHAEAQNKLGVCYSVGEGVAQNIAEGVKWFRKAAERGNVDAVKALRTLAEQGNVVAQLAFGECSDSGDGVATDDTEAVKWLGKAADRGDPNAQFRLGQCYAGGKGVAKNESHAVEWFRKAAEQGNANAQFALATCYLGGRGVSKNKQQAAEWYRSAAQQGHSGAQAVLQENKGFPTLFEKLFSAPLLVHSPSVGPDLGLVLPDVLSDGDWVPDYISGARCKPRMTLWCVVTIILVPLAAATFCLEWKYLAVRSDFPLLAKLLQYAGGVCLVGLYAALFLSRVAPRWYWGDLVGQLNRLAARLVPCLGFLAAATYYCWTDNTV
jgi:TPR repeat protein